MACELRPFLVVDSHGTKETPHITNHPTIGLHSGAIQHLMQSKDPLKIHLVLQEKKQSTEGPCMDIKGIQLLMGQEIQEDNNQVENVEFSHDTDNPIEVPQQTLMWMVAAKDTIYLALHHNMLDSLKDEIVRKKLEMDAMVIGLLLASKVVYSLSGPLDDRVITELKWIQDLPRHIRVHTVHDEDVVAKQLRQYLPAFTFFHQDFKASWLTIKKTEGTPRRRSIQMYLQDSLQLDSSQGEDVMAQNQTKNLIKHFFSKLENVTLPPIANQTYEDQLKALQRKFLDQKDSKNVDGYEVHGSLTVEIAKCYLKALNEGDLPCIRHAVDAIVEFVCKTTCKQAEEHYNRTISQNLNESMPYTSEEFFLAHLNSLVQAVNMIEKVPLEKKHIARMKPHCLELSKKIKELKSQFIATNKANSLKACQQSMIEFKLQAALLESTQSKALVEGSETDMALGLEATLLQSKTKVESLIRDYKQVAKGPETAPYLVQVLDTAELEEWMARSELEMDNHQLQKDIDETKKIGANELQLEVENLERLRQRQISEIEERKKAMELRKLRDLELHAENEETTKRELNRLANVRQTIMELEESAIKERERRREDVGGKNEEILTAQRGHHKEEKTLLYGRSNIVQRLLDLERDLAESKSKHVQKIFNMKQEAAAALETEKNQCDQELIDLKSRFEGDKASMKRAHEALMKKLKQERAEVESTIENMKEKAGIANTSDSDLCNTH